MSNTIQQINRDSKTQIKKEIKSNIAAPTISDDALIKIAGNYAYMRNDTTSVNRINGEIYEIIDITPHAAGFDTTSGLDAITLKKSRIL